jgi:hypothetical protein
VNWFWNPFTSMLQQTIYILSTFMLMQHLVWSTARWWPLKLLTAALSMGWWRLNPTTALPLTLSWTVVNRLSAVCVYVWDAQHIHLWNVGFLVHIIVAEYPRRLLHIVPFLALHTFAVWGADFDHLHLLPSRSLGCWTAWNILFCLWSYFGEWVMILE